MFTILLITITGHWININVVLVYAYGCQIISQFFSIILYNYNITHTHMIHNKYMSVLDVSAVVQRDLYFSNKSNDTF